MNGILFSSRKQDLQMHTVKVLCNIMFKWRCDHRSGNYNLSNCKWNPKKIPEFNGIRTHGLCISAAVLYQLSHTLRVGQFVEFMLTRERNIMFALIIFINCQKTFTSTGECPQTQMCCKKHSHMHSNNRPHCSWHSPQSTQAPLILRCDR